MWTLLAVVFWNARRADTSAGQYSAALEEFHCSLNTKKPPGFRFSNTFRVGALPWFNPKCEIYEDWYILNNFAAMDALDQVVVEDDRMDAHRYLMKNTAGASGAIFYLTKGTARVDRMSEANWMARPRGVSVDNVVELAKSQDEDIHCSVWTRAMALGPSENCLLTNRRIDLPKHYHPTRTHRELVWSPSMLKP